MNQHVTSNNQSGGITANNVTTGNNSKIDVSKRKSSRIALIVVLSSIAAIITCIVTIIKFVKFGQ